MSIQASASLRITCVTAVAALLAGCGGAPSPSPTPSPVPSPTGADFTLEVVPDMSIGRTIGGQRVVFLVTVSGAAGDAAVDLSAEAPGATIAVEPERLAPGDVAEVTVIPAAVAAERELEVTITATRAGVERQETRKLAMAPGENSLGPEAEAMLARFIPWLAANRPQLGITEGTEWQGTPGSWVLVVNHYIFFSEKWELGIEWHVMIAPDDWARIYLRERWTETTPSAAFEISSVTAGGDPREIAPPDAVWR